jgi:hypothetical protein
MTIEDIKEIFVLPKVDEVGMFTGLHILSSKVDVKLLSDERYNLYYIVSVDDILQSDLAIDELISVYQSGWVLDDDHKFIRKTL